MKTCSDARRSATMLRLLPALSLLFVPAAWAAVTVGDAWVREVPPSSPVAAAFLTLENSGAKPVRLVEIESPLADKVHWHDMTLEGGVMRMKVRPKVILPARSQVKLAPGGSHLMLLGVKQPLAVGTSVPLTLRFDNRQVVSVVAVVKRTEVTAPAAAGHQDHH